LGDPQPVPRDLSADRPRGPSRPLHGHGEGTGGGDLLALCQENLVYRCDLADGIRRNLLCHFRDSGVRAVAGHSGEGSAPRTSSLERLAARDIDIIFAIDIFNEGGDVPDVDTVLMLRPTESPVIWLQQFGRGLRLAQHKDHLAVIDYFGNHRSFLLKPQALLGLGSADREVWLALWRLEEGELALPPGCEVTCELEAKEILRSLLRHPSGKAEVLELCESFVERYGKRPTALEALHEGHDPRSVRKKAGSWFRFLESREYLTEEESAVLAGHGEFLKQLEGTPTGGSGSTCGGAR